MEKNEQIKKYLKNYRASFINIVNIDNIDIEESTNSISLSLIYDLLMNNKLFDPFIDIEYYYCGLYYQINEDYENRSAAKKF